MPYDPNSPNQFELCFLARLESAADPIQDEVSGDESATKTNIIYSNNIVTRNTFLLPIPLVMQGASVPTPTPVKYIFIKNADDFIKNLNITFEKLSGALDCTGEVYIDFLLSDELWDKWGSTGFKSEGIAIIAPKLVRITDCTAAKLLDIPFNPKERQPLGLKAELASGKQEQESSIPIDFTFKISHESANPAVSIKPPTACLFKMDAAKGNNNPNNTATTQLKVFPNPFAYDFTLQFTLPKTDNVTIGVYDMQGRLVQEVLNAEQQEGLHTIYVNGRNLPSGMYLCRLHSSQGELMSKLVKIR